MISPAHACPMVDHPGQRQSAAAQPLGSRLLGSAGQRPVALRVRVQSLLTVTLMAANVLGAVIVVVLRQGGFGTVCLVGIEGTASYGACLARHVTTAGVHIVEVDRSDRQDSRRQGKSDPCIRRALSMEPAPFAVGWLSRHATGKCGRRSRRSRASGCWG
jgi:hypothetical protein